MTLRIVMTAAITMVAAPAWAASGFFNMPSTLPQSLGCGYGPGYHATMVLKPSYRSWNAGHGIVRARPRDYPPIYDKHTIYGGFEDASSLAYVESLPHPTISSAPRPRQHAPAARSTFAPPAIGVTRGTAGRVEPTSPSDSLRPDELPMP